MFFTSSSFRALATSSFLAVLLVATPAVLAQTPNLVFGASVSQSTVASGADASRAADGGYDGNFGNGSVSQTWDEQSPWWQVDLGAVYDLAEIRIWNRRDFGKEDLADFYVLVSDVPFDSTDLATTLLQPGVSAFHHTGPADGERGIVHIEAPDRTGRYVRIQLENEATLRLTEVEVFPVGATPGAPRTFTVDTTSDAFDTSPGDGFCWTSSAECSLRAALQEAALDGAPTLIQFAIPGVGPHVIEIDRELPPLYDAFGGTTIDGFSQPGSSPNTLAVGSDAVLQIEITSDNESERGFEILGAHNVLRGLSIWDVRSYALLVQGRQATDNTMSGLWLGLSADESGEEGPSTAVRLFYGAQRNVFGGPLPADRNVVVHGNRAIDVRNSFTWDNVIENNYIGVSPDGLTPAGNSSHAVDLNGGAIRTTIRGNVIVASRLAGIEVSHTLSNHSHLIEDNIIGGDPFLSSTNPVWGNGLYGIGIEDEPHDITVRNNVVVHNQAGGIRTFKDVEDVIIDGNYVGLYPSGVAAPNETFGIFIQDGTLDVMVGPGNVVAYNKGPGLRVSAGTERLLPTDEITVSNNSFFENEGLGILHVNDPPNPVPTISSASRGLIEGTACAGCIVEVFRAVPDPSGAGEGALFLGSIVAAGDGSFAIAPDPADLMLGDAVTGTGTENDDTSMFAANTVVESRAPTADFTWQCDALVCDFDASSSSDDVAVVSYAWDWTSNGSDDASGETPSHSFATSGTYLVRLTVFDDEGESATVQKSVTVTSPPSAAFTFACTFRTCTFDGSGSTDDLSVVAYQWDFDDNGTVDASGVQAQYTFPLAGSYPVRLVVFDGDSNSDSETKVVTVASAPPTAAFNWSCDALSCTFDGSGSTDDLSVVTYQWDFDSSGTVDTTGVEVRHNFSQSGSHAVRLTVLDGDGNSDSETHVVTITSAPPSASFIWSCDDQACSFDGSSSSDDVGVVTWEWDFDGNGTVDATGPRPSFDYPAAGAYQVTLRVWDGDGQVASVAQGVAVGGTPPTAAIGYQCSGLSCDFHAEARNGATGNVVEFRWDWNGDGAIDATGKNVTHSFAGSGSQTVRLIVVEDDGDQTMVVETVDPEAAGALFGMLGPF